MRNPCPACSGRGFYSVEVFHLQDAKHYNSFSALSYLLGKYDVACKVCNHTGAMQSIEELAQRYDRAQN